MACRSGGWTTLSSVHFTATAYASVLDSQAALASQDAETIGARQKAAEKTGQEPDWPRGT